MNHDIRNTCGKKRGCTLTKFYIYCLINPLDNTIRYVGVTKRTLKKRLAEHIQKSKYKQTRKDYWIQSLVKKGVLPVIEEIDIVDDLIFWEKHYISLYKSWGFDLVNGTSGGDNGELTLESKKKISEKLKGNTHGFKKGHFPISGFKKGHSINKKNKTKEHKLKISLSKLNVGSIAVYQYDLQGNFIKEWISASKVQRELGILNSKINMVCKGKRNKAGGFIWKYKSM